ncbi:proteasome assembly chaperone family protein [Candidatus Micrarchaeota archaeon]|nr:proteasome assembly chaperone family protein [Candidatus Micrarchaeota archaeon]
MRETIIIEKEKIKVKKGVLVVGLPGIGLIGRVVGRYLAEELKGKKIADLYSPHFPHQVFMTKKGGLRLINNRFYWVKGKKYDLIVLTGDIQAMSTVGQYEVASAIIEYSKRIGINLIVTVGGYSTGRVNEHRKIFAVTTSKSLLSRFKKLGVVFGEARGSIVGAAGLLPAMGKLQGVHGICVMGETHGGYVDVTAAKNIVELLSTYLDFEIDLKKLEEKAKESEKVLKKIEEEVQRSMIAPYEPGKKGVSYIR